MDWFNWVIMPLIIFGARIVDMTLGTMRVIAINKGLRNIAPLIGFFEVMIWIVVVRQVIVDMKNPIWFIAYALGFAAGNYVGIYLSEKMSLSQLVVRIMIKKDSKKLVDKLEKEGYNVTLVKTTHKNKTGTMIFTNIHSSELKETIEIIKQYNPNAVYSIEEDRQVSNALFPIRNQKKKMNFGFNKLMKSK